MNEAYPLDTVSNESHQSFNRWSILEEYHADEQKRVDRIKSDMEESPHHEWNYRSEQIAIPPSTLRKFGRVAMDLVGIHPRKTEERRNREAMHIALEQIDEERAAKEMAFEEETRRFKEEEARQKAEREALREKEEQEAIERGLSDARDSFDKRKRELFRGQRIQEIVERGLNARLTTIESLEEEVLFENPGVEKRSLVYEDTEIPVYDLRGLPFVMLSTTIDYRKANKPGEIGTETFRAVMDDPSVWAERQDIAQQSSGYGTRNGNARGDTISASYYNSERNMSSHVSGELIYGFDHVEADSIISITNGDGGTSNMAGKARTALKSPDVVEREIEGGSGTSVYNEFLLRRYSENGMPKLPNYIIAWDGKISDTALKHAKYYNIPIVNVETRPYKERMHERGEELLTSISEDDDYEELDRKINEITAMSEYKGYFYNLNGIGRSDDILSDRPSMTDIEKRFMQISRMEQKKRIDFIEDVLRKSILEIQEKTKEGKRVSFGEVPGFDYFYASKPGQSITPGNYDYVRIEFRLNGSSRGIKTTIYDGEHMHGAKEVFAKGIRTPKDLEGADSSYFERIAPLVKQYEEALRENYLKTAK